jgi:hypothetical protein
MNLFSVFKTPPNRDAIEIKIKYGKQILPKTTVRANFSPRTLNPDTKTLSTHGKNAIIIVQNIVSIATSAVNISAKTMLASCFPSLWRTFENLGKNDELNAPSAKIRRNVFANLSAIISASVCIPAPRQNTITHSRRNPIILLKNVNDPTVKAALITPMSMFRIKKS